MARIRPISFVIILVVALNSCTGEVSSSADHGLDTLYNPKYANKFVLLKDGNNIILDVKDPWQGAKATEKRYTISQPFKRIVSMSTSHLAFLDALDCSKSVLGVSGKDYISSPSFKDAVEVGFDRNLEFEKVLSLKPDVMLVYEVSGETSSLFGKLTSLGVNVIYIADYLESSPLGRAEWIIAFGAMTGKYNEALEYFSKIESAYNNIKNTTTNTNCKVILNSPYQDVWYFPGTESYSVKFIEDAGGTYVADQYKGENSTPVSMETAYKILKSATLWLNPSKGVTSKESLWVSNPSLKGIDIPLFSNDKRSTPIGGSDFYEQGVVRPDLILKDLSLIFKYKENTPEDSLYFYKQLH